MKFWLLQGSAGETSQPEDAVEYTSLEAAMDARKKMFGLIVELPDGENPYTGKPVPYGFRQTWYHTPACGWYQWNTDSLPFSVNQWDCTNPLASFYVKEYKPNAN